MLHFIHKYFAFFRFVSNLFLISYPGAREYTILLLYSYFICRHCVASRYLGYTMNRFFLLHVLPSSLLRNCPHKCLKDTDTIIMYSLPWGNHTMFPLSPFCSTSFSFLSITINIINALIVKVTGGIESLVWFSYFIFNK